MMSPCQKVKINKRGENNKKCAKFGGLLGFSQIVSANATSINSSDWTQTVEGQVPNFEDNTADIRACGLLGANPN